MKQHLISTLPTGITQTLGRWAAILLLRKSKPASTVYDYARHGLLVGLGFTTVEITYIYFAVAWAQALLGYLSVWERYVWELRAIGVRRPLMSFSNGRRISALWKRCAAIRMTALRELTELFLGASCCAKGSEPLDCLNPRRDGPPGPSFAAICSD